MDRVVRASQLIGEIVSTSIVRGQVKDPRVSSLCSVVSVDVSKDLRYATVRITGYMGAGELKSAVKGLNAASGFLQSRIASQVHWKVTPKLRFVVDTTIRQAQSVVDALDSMEITQPEGVGPADGPGGVRPADTPEGVESADAPAGVESADAEAREEEQVD